MTRAVWDTLLAEARRAHTGPIARFCPFPDDVTERHPTRHRVPVADLFEADGTVATSPLACAFQTASAQAQWRETYKGTAIAQDFMDRFGCYCLIGSGGAFTSAEMSAYVVYMPPHLDYPAHQHPAEELYYILAGEAEFRRDGEGAEILRAGDTSQHQSNQPHATRTFDQPVLAYVLWRNHLGTPPIWTEAALR